MKKDNLKEIFNKWLVSKNEMNFNQSTITQLNIR